MSSLKECPNCNIPVNYEGLIEDFECSNCGWVLEEVDLDVE